MEIAPKNALILAKYGLILRMQGKLEAAVTAYQEAIVIDPKNSSVLVEYAETLVLQNKLEDASKEFLKAL